MSHINIYHIKFFDFKQSELRPCFKILHFLTSSCVRFVLSWTWPSPSDPCHAPLATPPATCCTAQRPLILRFISCAVVHQ